MTDKIVRFSTDITAADAERRTIVGTVVPYGSVGETSLGPVTFAAGSISRSDTVKLVLEHDMKRPIGRASAFVDGPERLVGTFRLSHTTAASDALVEASDGLRDGLSVGARIREHTIDENGVMVVTAADLVEVSLVHTPAFSDAVVTQVAASTPEDGDTPDESEEDIVQNETTEVAAAEVAASPEPTVEAARPSIPYITQNMRALDNMTAGRFAKAQLLAQAGDHDSQSLVTAALADNTTTTGAGLIPTRFLRDVISVIDSRRPVVDSITREALPDAGDEFKIPRVTQKPSVAEQVAEGNEVSSTAFELDFLTVPVKTFAGGERISRQLIERSDPAFIDRLLLEMAAQYAQRTDAFAWSVLNAGKGESNGDTIYKTIADAIADSWDVMRFAPDRLLVTPNGTGDVTFAKLLAEVDGEDRPLFASANPSNAGGLISQGTTQGTVAGLQLVVDANIGDVEAFVYPSAAATFYEVAGAPIQVSVQDVSTLEVEVAVYGYVACAAKYPTAVRFLNVA